MDYDQYGVAWCNTCKAIQRKRNKKAEDLTLQKRAWSQALANFNNSTVTMGAFADKFASPGQKWCRWGLHYHPEELRQVKTHYCKNCYKRDYTIVNKKRWRTKTAFHKKSEQYQQDLKEQRQELAALKVEIAQQRERLKVLHEEVFVENKPAKPAAVKVNGRQNAQPDMTVDIRIVAIPVEDKQRNKRVAKSYT